MRKFLIRVIINALALFIAIFLLDGRGIHAQAMNWTGYLGLGLIFGIVNAFLKPILSLLTCPLIILTLGLFTLVINTFMFYLAGTIGDSFGIGFQVDGFLPALFGSILTSIVSVLLSILLKEEDD